VIRWWNSRRKIEKGTWNLWNLLPIQHLRFQTSQLTKSSRINTEPANSTPCLGPISHLSFT
jgi:hypothetical protein